MIVLVDYVLATISVMPLVWSGRPGLDIYLNVSGGNGAENRSNLLRHGQLILVATFIVTNSLRGRL